MSKNILMVIVMIMLSLSSSHSNSRIDFVGQDIIDSTLIKSEMFLKKINEVNKVK